MNTGYSPEIRIYKKYKVYIYMGLPTRRDLQIPLALHTTQTLNAYIFLTNCPINLKFSGLLDGDVTVRLVSTGLQT